MINLNFSLSNPFSNRFENVYNRYGKISQNKTWEFEIIKTNTVLSIDISVRTRADHGGIQLGIGLCGYVIYAQIYDNRHWDKSRGTYND